MSNLKELIKLLEQVDSAMSGETDKSEDKDECECWIDPAVDLHCDRFNDEFRSYFNYLEKSSDRADAVFTLARGLTPAIAIIRACEDEDRPWTKAMLEAADSHSPFVE